MTVTFNNACLNTFLFDSKGCDCGQTIDCTASPDHICIGDASLFTFIVDPPPPPPPCDPPATSIDSDCYDTPTEEELGEFCGGTYTGDMLPPAIYCEITIVDGYEDVYKMDGTAVWFTYKSPAIAPSEDGCVYLPGWSHHWIFPDRILHDNFGSPLPGTYSELFLVLRPSCDYKQDECGIIQLHGYMIAPLCRFNNPGGTDNSCADGFMLPGTEIPLSGCDDKGCLNKTLTWHDSFNVYNDPAYCPGGSGFSKQYSYKFKWFLNPPKDF